MTALMLDLAVGSGVVLDGAEWTVEQLEPQYGKVASPVTTENGCG
jgi:hypothetical protein